MARINVCGRWKACSVMLIKVALILGFRATAGALTGASDVSGISLFLLLIPSTPARGKSGERETAC